MKDLLEREDRVKKVICLVRAKSTESDVGDVERSGYLGREVGVKWKA